MSFPSFSIRTCTYRGRDGFQVVGRHTPTDHRQCVFVETRELAVLVKAAMLRKDSRELSRLLTEKTEARDGND